MKHSLKDWVIATRPWSFPMSAMPVVVTTVYLFWKGASVYWPCVVLALLGMIVFHAAGNLLSDWWDYKKGIDNEEAYAVPNLVFKRFEPKEYLVYSFVLFAVGLLIGLAVVMLTGWEILIIGAIGFLLATTYYFFKIKALGDIFVFVCFAVLPILGTTLVAGGEIIWDSIAMVIPLGLITIAVLHDNNTVDIKTDGASGIHTVPMFLGEKASVVLYIVYMVLPYLCVLVACILGYLPWLALSCILSAPVAFKNASTAYGYFTRGREAMIGLDEKTAQLHMIFSITMALGLGIAAAIGM